MLTTTDLALRCDAATVAKALSSPEAYAEWCGDLVRAADAVVATPKDNVCHGCRSAIGWCTCQIQAMLGFPVPTE